jgi:hypothetical protein
MDDGTEMQVEPDLKAIQQVLSIMDRRTKLLGMEQTNLNVNVDTNSSAIRAVIAGQPGLNKPATGFDAESEAKKLLELMAIAGVLPEGTIKSLLGADQAEIIDAEIVGIEGSATDEYLEIGYDEDEDGDEQ